jgi:hypothetical protein
VERVDGVVVSGCLGGGGVEEEVHGRQRSLPVGWACGGGAGHVEECVGSPLGLGAAQFRHVDVAVTEAGDGVGPVAGELAVDVPAENLEELGSADVVESGVQTPRSIGLLVHGGGAEFAVVLGLGGGADGVGECFEGECSAFELDVGEVHRVDHQFPDASGEDVGVDAGVGGDACHEPCLGDTDLSAGEGVVPHCDGATQPGFLEASVGFGTRQLQAVLHPGFGGEVALVAERQGGVEVIGHRDAGGGGLAAELFDTDRPRCRGGRVEP